MNYGLAIDIGTTNIKMVKVDMESGSALDGFLKKNSQKQFGADVLSRIKKSCAGHAGQLAECIRQDILSGMAALNAETPEQIAITGNTTMVALLCGDDVSGMQEYPFTPQRLQIAPGKDIRIAPAAGAFLGGDVVAGLSVLPKGTNDFLFIDLGTNGEMVLKSGDTLMAASAAAGPAFEYMADASGSMLLEVLKTALEEGIVDETGLLSEEWFETGYLWKAEDGTSEFLLTQQKIRDLQLAKAAIRTGVDFLTEQYQTITGKSFLPEQVYLAGGMGVVSEEACIRIGMLPTRFQGLCRFLGNTSLKGAEKLLLQPESFREMQKIAEKMQVFNLASWDKFNKNYIDNINF